MQLRSLLVPVALLGCQEEIPPLGEALVVVDTDMVVPTLAGSLRIDLYRRDLSLWYESREIALLDPRDWPASFSIVSPHDSAAGEVLVRLRVFPRGKVRDYRGERFGPRPSGGPPGDPAFTPPPPDGETPRLESSDGAPTPVAEPQPMLTVDRLFRLRLEPGRRGRAHVVMRGACVGTMADLQGGQTCLDTAGQRHEVAELALDPEIVRPTTTEARRFGRSSPCNAEVRPGSLAPDGAPLFDAEICVPGGAFVFGNEGDLDPDDVPERVAVIRPFRLDRYEVTVARWRKAITEGFRSPDATPRVNEQAIDLDGDLALRCTWSTVERDREALPLTCVSQAAARAFCQHLGGDLPTEAEWEYAAQAALRPAETIYPWGDEQPTCDRAVYGLDPGAGLGTGGELCVDRTGRSGPQRVDLGDHPLGDLYADLGVVGLAGGVSELVRDTFEPLGDNCWIGAPPEQPVCLYDGPTVTGRGGTWALGPGGLGAGVRFGDYRGEEEYPATGFRCMRAAEP